MTDARLERVPDDPREARVYVGQAKAFLRDGTAAGNADASRVVLLHNAATAAADAILLSAGWRVSAGDSAHVMRLDKAIEILGGDEDLADRLDDARINRNEASYGAIVPANADVAAAVAATEELVALAEAFVGDADQGT